MAYGQEEAMEREKAGDEDLSEGEGELRVRSGLGLAEEKVLVSVRYLEKESAWGPYFQESLGFFLSTRVFQFS